MTKKFILGSWGFSKLGLLEHLLDFPLRYLPWGLLSPHQIAGWGNKRSGRLACRLACLYNVDRLRLEDGFVRSFCPGLGSPGLSMVVDSKGIFYDCNTPSDLENLLQSDANLAAEQYAAVLLARDVMLQHDISKYNHAPSLPAGLLRTADTERVLIIDQTRGDMSVLQGGADAGIFRTMLQAAIVENPGATIYVKTHPEVTSGAKGGYLSDVQPSEQIVPLRGLVNPVELLREMDKVYVVTSGMGFEALLLGKPVSCFGMPWYAGWGVTDDRQSCARRTRQRSVDELFVAAYGKYTRYLNPETHRRGTLSDVLPWILRQREIASRFPGRMIVVGFKPKKIINLQGMLSLFPGQVHSVDNAEAAAQLQPQGKDCLICWGRVLPEGLEALATQTGVRLLRMEDGFVRSVGLGSDHVPPMSFVLDASGIYFDPGQSSDLEAMLNSRDFTVQDLERARHVRKFIVAHGITKYNMEPLQAVRWRGAEGRQVVLVPGQVEDDASIRFGCDPQGVCTNLGLLQAARKAFPEAFVVYKPHPDVSSGNRVGVVPQDAAIRLANHVEARASVVSCIEACDVVVTMTSLTGFDALLRGKQVVVHGRPFYAGWGLTQDKIPVPRRNRTLDLDQLVAAALLHYPLYWDAELKGYTSCEAVLHRLLEQRQQRGEGRRWADWGTRRMRKIRATGRGVRNWWQAIRDKF